MPDGDGEEENILVSEWGQEYIKRGEARMYMQRSGVAGLFLQPVLDVHGMSLSTKSAVREHRVAACHSSRFEPRPYLV